MKLQGRAAIITGGGRGLGRAAAMAGEGAGVTVMSRTRQELTTVADEIERTGGRCHVFSGDVSEEARVAAMVEKTLERFGHIDILVNNAAVIGPPLFSEDGDFSSWSRTMDINLEGAVSCARRALPDMIKRGSGKIINISSGLGQMPFPRFCAYAVSKAGIIQLTRSLAEELKGSNIQVNAIDPGVMDTRMQEQIRDLGPDLLGRELHERFVSYWNNGLLLDPAEVASLAVFLASSDSDHLTGYNEGLQGYRRLGWRPADRG
ncbi:MAG: SDR family oxidoreductase [Desulfohalobiaceae bacterium]|nr:SDR family oxidoreductase [Desulfohalobiaceae bacterium]